MINDWFNSKDRIKDGIAVPENFSYSSDNNADWMSVEALRAWINKNL